MGHLAQGPVQLTSVPHCRTKRGRGGLEDRGECLGGQRVPWITTHEISSGPANSLATLLITGLACALGLDGFPQRLHLISVLMRTGLRTNTDYVAAARRPIIARESSAAVRDT